MSQPVWFFVERWDHNACVICVREVHYRVVIQLWPPDNTKWWVAFRDGREVGHSRKFSSLIRKLWKEQLQ